MTYLRIQVNGNPSPSRLAEIKARLFSCGLEVQNIIEKPKMENKKIVNKN